MKKNYNEKLKQYAVQSALKEAGGRNTKALLALVELDEIVLNEDGTIDMLDRVILKNNYGKIAEEIKWVKPNRRKRKMLEF